MTTSVHLGECSNKILQIIKVAQKRFGQYGFEKTTMNEIASDLNMSKGSLYYYFPDKEHLYFAVVQKEHEYFLELVHERIVSLSDASQMIREYINVRVSYVRKLMNLNRLRHDDARELHSKMQDLCTEFRTKEKKLIARILTIGIENQQFESCDVNDYAELLLDTMKGLSFTSLRNGGVFYLAPEEYNRLLRMINLFMEIFIKSLKR